MVSHPSGDPALLPENPPQRDSLGGVLHPPRRQQESDLGMLGEQKGTGAAARKPPEATSGPWMSRPTEGPRSRLDLQC